MAKRVEAAKRLKVQLAIGVLLGAIYGYHNAFIGSPNSLRQEVK